jgi:ankyrin repeat protein
VRDRSKDVEICRLLLRHGADVNARNLSGQTPLHLAVRCHLPDVVDLLLHSNADPNACDDRDVTPLRLAIQERQIEMVKELLISRAEVSDLYTRDEEGSSFMDRLGATMLPDDRFIIRLVTHVKDNPFEGRIQTMVSLNATERTTSEEDDDEEARKKKKKKKKKKNIVNL